MLSGEKCFTLQPEGHLMSFTEYAIVCIKVSVLAFHGTFIALIFHLNTILKLRLSK